MNVFIPVSPGELADKITILEIKSRKIKSTVKLKSIKSELVSLKKVYRIHIKLSRVNQTKLSQLKHKLYKINIKLWNIENNIREKESKSTFDKEFIKLARSVYITNDKRSEIKNSINILFGSNFKEVKQYSEYRKK
ncbi:MAG: hypothetical protein IT280_08500 [Ignavibacteria bacterium]|nr:hypothetical protein [Ignavibacteria bacterium]